MAYSHHHDDSFFIESDEPNYTKLNSRSAAKMMACARQDIIASELSRLTGDEYLEDILRHMRHMEV